MDAFGRVPYRPGGCSLKIPLSGPIYPIYSSLPKLPTFSAWNPSLAFWMPTYYHQSQSLIALGGLQDQTYRNLPSSPISIGALSTGARDIRGIWADATWHSQGCIWTPAAVSLRKRQYSSGKGLWMYLSLSSRRIRAILNQATAFPAPAPYIFESNPAEALSVLGRRVKSPLGAPSHTPAWWHCQCAKSPQVKSHPCESKTQCGHHFHGNHSKVCGHQVKYPTPFARQS